MDYRDRIKLGERYGPLDFVMMYGSGVFRQESYNNQEKPLVDLVFGVESTKEWHDIHLQKNRGDYSGFARLFGVRFVEWLQHTGPGIYYHPFVPFGDHEIKYGVIGTEDIIRDLVEWTHLYVAGRMHKPVLTSKTYPRMQSAAEKNLGHAVNVALLLLPDRFTQRDLYVTITRLSYTGDSRMNVGENPQKAENIVEGNLEGFQTLYDNRLQGNVTLLGDDRIEQDMDPQVQEQRYSSLPVGLRKHIPAIMRQRELMQQDLQQGLARIVSSGSIIQTLKGIASAGLWRSLKYGSAKVGKKLRGKNSEKKKSSEKIIRLE